MAQESIDFGNFSKKILINPVVPLQVLEIYYRNNSRIQATLLGKVYSNAIEILDVVPYALCEPNDIKKLDFAQHSKAIENAKIVYPHLQVVGVAVTDLKPEKNLAILHTMYVNKESDFKAQGILTNPIILSIGTKIEQKAENFAIDAYCFNQPYFFCRDLMGLTSFEKLETTISFGDADIESMAPLFEAMNDQQKFVAGEDVESLVKKLVQNLSYLKIKCESSQNEQLRVKIRRIIDRLSFEHDYNIEELSYLLDYAALQRIIGSKINKIESDAKV